MGKKAGKKGGKKGGKKDKGSKKGGKGGKGSKSTKGGNKGGKKGDFVDPDFPHAPKSLGSNFQDSADKGAGKANPKGMKWTDATELSKGKPKVFDDINVNDIRQGSLGDCWFLAAVAAVAEDEDRIKNVFLTQKYPKDGKHRLRMFKHGVPQIVEIDDYFPTTNGRLSFARTTGGEMWVPLLEKAYAKLHTSYGNLAGGQAGDGMFDLTGAPSYSYDFEHEGDDADTVWDKLVEWDELGYIMTTGGVPKGNEKKTGLISGHAYSLIGVVDVGDARLVKIRNPWGAGEWKGDWSDKSDMWTKKAKKKADFVDADDGLFHMDVDDFVRYFTRMSVCMYQEDWTYHACQVDRDARDHAQWFRLDIDEDDTEIVVGFAAEDIRAQPTYKKKKLTKVASKVWIFNGDEPDLVAITPRVHPQYVNPTDAVTLDSGTYYVYAEWKDFNKSTNLAGAVFTYASEEVTLTRLEPENNSANQDFLCALAYQSAIENGDANGSLTEYKVNSHTILAQKSGELVLTPTAKAKNFFVYGAGVSTKKYPVHKAKQAVTASGQSVLVMGPYLNKDWSWSLGYGYTTGGRGGGGGSDGADADLLDGDLDDPEEFGLEDGDEGFGLSEAGSYDAGSAASDDDDDDDYASAPDSDDDDDDDSDDDDSDDDDSDDDDSDDDDSDDDDSEY